MKSWKQYVKKVFFPVTLLTVASILCLIVLVEAIYKNFFAPDLFSGIYLSIAAPITMAVWFFYLIDRVLLRKFSYKIIVFSEIGIALLLLLMFSYQNSKTTIRFDTNNSFVLVLFDNPNASSAPFERKGIFDKELFIRDTNIIHIHPNLAFKKGLKIETPKDWAQTTTDQSSVLIDGKKTSYLFVTNSELPKSYLMNNQKYIDSLLQINITK